MRDISISSEAHAIAAFLRAEVDSPRFGPNVAAALSRLGSSRSIIDSPQLTDEAENFARGQLLGYRGYLDRTMLFAGFPREVLWRSAVMLSEECRELRVINQQPWTDWAGPSRLAAEAAASLVANGAENPGVHIAAVADALRAGLQPPPLLVVGTALESPLVILEGHVRVMACLDRDIALEMPVLVGTSKEMSQWAWY